MSSFASNPNTAPPSKRAIVIGAGIAGLTAAAALRKSGYSVNIFERSKFATETGAALIISPNGAKVLESLAFDFQKAQACRVDTWETVHGSDLKRFSAIDFTDAKTRYGHLVRSIHRVDLHNELLRIALKSPDVKLHLSSTVTNVDCLDGSIRLADGNTRSADLVVAADGVHSVARDAVAQTDTQLSSTEMSAFRFLVDTAVVKNDPVTAELLQSKSQSCTIIADTLDTEKERHMVWYGCRDGTVQNFVGIHPTRQTSDLSPKAEMLQEFEHFHPAIARLINLAEEIKCWPLHSYKPLKTLYRGRVVLIGDSAHPVQDPRIAAFDGLGLTIQMLPFGGQGSNQAIEDAGALGSVLQSCSSSDEQPERLEAYEMLRLNRVSMVQLLSAVRVGREMEIRDQLTPYASTTDQIPTSFAERIQHHYGYDILSETRELLARKGRSTIMAV